MKEVFFLSGLPRSGSTLLGSIMGQNPSFTVTPTSPLLDLLCHTNDGFKMLSRQYTFEVEAASDRVYRGIVKSYYENITTDYVLDKHRGYPKNIESVKRYISKDPKVICANRPLAEVISSFISLIEKNQNADNFVDATLLKMGLQINVSNRAKCLWENYISDPYESMRIGLTKHRDHMLVVEYDDLVLDNKKTMSRIYEFLGVQQYDHSTHDLENYCAEEKDHMWGLEGLHVIRDKVAKTSVPPEKVLGRYLTDFYNGLSLS